MMKKILKSLIVAILPLVFLGVGCSNQSTSTQNSEATSVVAKKTATIKVVDKTKGKTLGNKQVAVKQGETILAALKDTYQVTESKGFVSEIEHVKQDDQAGAYWTFTVNGKDATKGAGQIKLAKKDKVVFTLSIYEK